MIGIGFLGFGTVGRSTYEILTNRKFEIEKYLGKDVVIRKIIVRDPSKYDEIEDIISTDIMDLINDEDIDVIIEATGQVDEIVDYIEAAIKGKKNIISANKALISKYYERLHSLSKQNKTELKYEASVGGGIPIISQLDNIRILNEVNQISGVLNGTCNFILSKMETGSSYEESLKEAQKLGYAEADPSADVSGLDSLRKLRILSSRVFNKAIKENEIDLCGITEIEKEEIEKAKLDGKKYKLIARADKYGNYKVGPELVDEESIFGGLVGGENAIIINGSNTGDLIFKGPGAGGKETAFSILSDFLSIYRC